jgi:hypothetical protein
MTGRSHVVDGRWKVEEIVNHQSQITNAHGHFLNCLLSASPCIW